MAQEYKAPGSDSEGMMWCFTHHMHLNTTLEELIKDCDNFPNQAVTLHTAHKNQFQILAGGFGLETCPTTGRQHVQGWMIMDKHMRFKQLKPMFCETIHWSKAFGTVAQNIEYCSKEGAYTAFGDHTGLENKHIK